MYLGKQKLPINVIVDSGASVNIIDAKLWESLKKQKITCKSEITTKKLYAYGTDKPLVLLGKFSTVIAVQRDCKSRKVYADFYVLKGAGPALLGRETAEQLGILSIEVNYVDDVRTEYKECFEGIGNRVLHEGFSRGGPPPVLSLPPRFLFAAPLKNSPPLNIF